MVLVVKNPAASAGAVRDEGLILELGRSAGGGHNNPLQYSCLENLMDQEAWQGYSPWAHEELGTTEWARMHVPYRRVWALSHRAVNLSPGGQEKCLTEYLGHFLYFSHTIVLPRWQWWCRWRDLAYCLILSPGKWDSQSRDLGSSPGPPLPSGTSLKPRVTILLQSFAVRNKRDHKYWSTW